MEHQHLLTRNMDINEVLSESIHFLTQNFLLITGIAVLSGLPMLIWHALSLTKPDEWVTPLRYRSARDLIDVLEVVRGIAGGNWDARLLASLCVSAYTGLLQAGALAYALAERLAERPVTPLQAMAQAFNRLAALTVGNGATVIVVLAVALVAERLPIGPFNWVAFALPLLALYPRWLLTTQAIMVEGRGGIASLCRSFELVRGRYGFVFGIWSVSELLLIIASLVPTFALGILSVSNLPAQTRQLANLIIPGVAAVVIDPFWHVTLLLLFFQLSRRARPQARVT